MVLLIPGSPFENWLFFFFQAEAGIRAHCVTGVQTCALPICIGAAAYGPVLDEQWDTAARGVDFFDVKADLENLIAPLPVRFEPAAHPALHPGRSARVLVDGRSEERRVGKECRSRWSADV